MKRWSQRGAWALGALAAVATLTFTASGASAAGAHPTSAQGSTPAAWPTPAVWPTPAAWSTAAQTRASLKSTLAGLRGVVLRMRANPLIAEKLGSTGTNLLPAIAFAQQLVDQLDAGQLAQAQASLESDPSWQQAPSTLTQAVEAFRPQAAPLGSSKNAAATSHPTLSGSGTFTDDCSTAGDPYAEDIAVLSANEVQSGLYAAAIALPGVFELAPLLGSPNPAKIVFAVAWGVANATYLALAQTLAVAVDCEGTAFGNTQSSTLPQDSSGTVVPASTQFSVDRLIKSAGDTQTKISGVEKTVETVKTRADSVATAVTALNEVLNDITNRVDEVKSDLQTLQTRVAVLRNTEVEILKKADSEIANLGALQSLQLRMKIEENLAKNGDQPLGIFQLPAAHGGYLEVVASIVTETIAKEAALGKSTAQAEKFLGDANAAFAAGQYKTAYTVYAKAYGLVR